MHVLMNVTKGMRVKFRDDFSRRVRGVVYVVTSDPAPWGDSGPRLFVWLEEEGNARATRSGWVDDLRSVE